jgi:hypothetical protein
MKLILENWRKYLTEQDSGFRGELPSEEAVIKEFRGLLLQWFDTYKPDTPLGKKLYNWIGRSNPKVTGLGANWEEVAFNNLRKMLEEITIEVGYSGQETSYRGQTVRKDSLASYGYSTSKYPTGIFIINYTKYYEGSGDYKRMIAKHEGQHWLDNFKNFMARTGRKKDDVNLPERGYASSSGEDLELLSKIFMSQPIEGHGLSEKQIAYFGSKVEQRAYLLTFSTSLSSEQLKKICATQKFIVSEGGMQKLIDEGKYTKLFEYLGKFKPELTLFVNCNDLGGVLDAASKFVMHAKKTSARYA